MAVKILSAGIVVLSSYRDYYRYLLLRAYNYWDFPKGVVEPGETPLQAAVREVREETDIQDGDLHFRWGDVYCETQPYNHGRKMARYYIAEASTTLISLPVNPSLGRPEHSDYRWVSRAAAAAAHPRVRAVLGWADEVLRNVPAQQN